MKLYKYTILSLALGAMMAACSDDDKYSLGESSPGVYFPNDADDVIYVTEDASSVNVPICRTEDTGSASYEVTFTDGSDGLFTPTSSTVTFSSGSLESYVTFTYNPTDLSAATKYPYSISVADGYTTIYGQSEYSFSFQLEAETTRTLIGTGLYTYDALFVGYDPGLECYEVFTEGSNMVTYEIEHWCYDVTLTVQVDYDVLLTNDGHPAYVMEQSTGYSESGYGEFTVLDYYTWLVERGEEPGGYYGWYVPSTGHFEIAMMYLCRAYSGTNGVTANYETFQLDGFPDYTLSITYDGILNDSEGIQSYVLASVTSSEDISSVRVGLYEGSVSSSMLTYLDDGTDVVTAGGGTTATVKVPVDKTGTYTLIAGGYDGGERQVYAYVSVTIDNFVIAQGEWEDVGIGSYVDGFILPYFGYTNTNNVFVALNPFEHVYDVLIQKEVSGAYENMYRLVDPYGPDSGNYIASYYNENSTNPRNISFDMSNTELVTFEYQYTGFLYSGDTQMWIYDDGWYYYNQGYRESWIKRNDLNSYYDSSENCVYVQSPRVTIGAGMDNLANKLGYNYPAIIYFPDESSKVKANYAAMKMVTNPTLNPEVVIGASTNTSTSSNGSTKTFVGLDRELKQLTTIVTAVE